MPIYWVIVLSLLFSLVLYLIISIPYVERTLIKKTDNERLRLTSILISSFSIVSIFVAVNTYYKAERSEEIRNKTVLENAINEARINIEFIDFFKRKTDFFRKSDNIPAERLNFFFLEQAVFVGRSSSLTRNLILRSINDMKQVNEIIIGIDAIAVTYSSAGHYKEYRKIKNENISSILETFKIIEKELKTIIDDLMFTASNN